MNFFHAYQSHVLFCFAVNENDLAYHLTDSEEKTGIIYILRTL